MEKAMKCPKCGAKREAGATECPVCGVIYWKAEMRAKEQANNKQPNKQANTPITPGTSQDMSKKDVSFKANGNFIDKNGNVSQQKAGRSAIVLFSFFCIAGAIIFIASLTVIVITSRETAHYEKTQGKVVSSLVRRETRTQHGRTEEYNAYTPLIEYEVDGHIYQVRGELHSELKPQTGMPVSIRYNPQNPQQAVIASKSFLGDFFLLFFGFCWFILGLFMLSMEVETKFLIRLRIPLLYLAFGTLGTGAYFYMGNSIGSFNPFTMIRATLWSLLPCLFLIVAGLGILSSISSIVFGTKPPRTYKTD